MSITVFVLFFIVVEAFIKADFYRSTLIEDKMK